MIEIFPKEIVEPSTLAETKDFLVSIARNREDIEKAQRLRYEVFNLEQKRGIKSADKYGIDFDEFDEYCLHLLVLDKNSQNVIGTYRAHLGYIANKARGFYSSREYEIHGLYQIADDCIELGRTCVSPEYRSGAIIALLWGGIVELIVRARLRYMLGCVSLDETDPAVGWALYQYLQKQHAAPAECTVTPRPGFRLSRPSAHIIDRLLADELALKKCIPPIFKGYLRLGARICGEPALDSEFGTIDFFILLDVTKAPERYQRHFNYRRPENI